MNSYGATTSSRRPIHQRLATSTAVGLLIAMFGAPAFTAAFKLVEGDVQTSLQLLAREFGALSLAAVLLWIIAAQERLHFTSIGLRSDKPGTSIGRGLLVGGFLIFVSFVLYRLLPKIGLPIGGRQGSLHPSLYLVTLVVLRASVVEEVFYRGYAIERLTHLFGRRWAASLASVTVFAVAHYRQGIGGVTAAALLGGFLTVFYLKFRDLAANMVAHFTVDFVLNVGIPLISDG